MNFNNRISASAMLVAASLTFSPAAWALGLGEAKVESYLNQPLKARIDLIAQASDDLTSVTAQMASAADYELIGASIEGIPVPLRFTVEDIEGDAYIAATSNLPINNPVLRVIVEVNWSSGRMLREYTLFLDPPMVPEVAPAPRIEQRIVAPAAPAPAPPAAPAEAGAAAPAQPRTQTETESPTARSGVAPVAGGEYGPVRSGQTLWGIAREWSRGSGLGINQVMIAIQRQNPEAFLNGNINLLKRGAILRMPESAQIEQISAATAYQEVATQAEEFRGEKASRSVASSATPLLSDERAGTMDEDGGASEFEIEPAAPVTEDVAEADEAPVADDPAADVDEAVADVDEAVADVDEAVAEAAGPGESQDLLELVPPSADSELDSGYGFEEADQPIEAEANVQALRENLARTEEELVNQQQQNEYLQERIRELESQVESADDGRVAEADLANMEERLRTERQAVQRPAESGSPWYSRLSSWLIGLLVAAALFTGWLLSRRGRAGDDGAEVDESLRSIKSEAEDVLRVLADDAKKADGEAADEAAGEEAQPEVEPEDAAATATPGLKAVHSEGEAELLDEDSSDPEIQLDLARAYISMGDKEAARVILEEVVGNGTEEQQAEARKMLEIL